MNLHRYQWTNHPFGCAHCECPPGYHGWRYITGIGSHRWERPTDTQILERMLRRRQYPANRWRSR